MAVEANAPPADAAVKTAFEDLLQQVNKHKELLRSSHKWPRRQKDKASRRNTSVPVGQTLAAVVPTMGSAEDVRSYVNVNLARLERFAEREIYFREALDFVAPDSVTKEEVIDETIAAALGDSDGPNNETPARLALAGAPTETVAISISAARDHLRKSPSCAGQFKGRFAPTGTA